MRLDRAQELLKAADSPTGELKAKIGTFKNKLCDLNKSIDDMCSEIAIDAELAAAAKLRDERAEIKKKALDDEVAAEQRCDRRWVRF